MSDDDHFAELRRLIGQWAAEQDGPGGLRARPIVRNVGRVRPIEDVLATLEQSLGVWGDGVAEAKWIADSTLRAGLLNHHDADVEVGYNRAAKALANGAVRFEPVDEHGRILGADEAALVAASVCMKRAWAISRAAYQRGAPPIYGDSVGYNVAVPDGLDPGRDPEGLPDVQGPPATPQVLRTVGAWQRVLSGYVHRVMIRPRIPTPRQLQRELELEGLDPMDVAAGCAFLVDATADELAVLCDAPDDGDRFYALVWQGQTQ